MLLIITYSDYEANVCSLLRFILTNEKPIILHIYKARHTLKLFIYNEICRHGSTLQY